MSDIVLDASAVLALVNGEPGNDVVLANLADGVISAVNLAEVVTKLTELALDEAEIRDSIDTLGLRVVPCDTALAFRAGMLRPATRAYGLSLGDRLCVALAQHLDAPVLTAERIWSKLDLGVEVRLIR